MRSLVNKKGLSPIIATVLLITIALILALIIFVWARSFIDEKVEKFNKAIELACPDVVFDAEAYINDDDNLAVRLVNTGNIPVYGVEVRKEGLGSRKILGVLVFQPNARSGETVEGVLTSDSTTSDSTVEADDKLILVPVILGEAQEYKKSHTCDDSTGIEVVVSG